MQMVFDRLRKVTVPLTPEEQVRQWFIGVLERDCRVPLSLMLSEWAFSYGNKQYRADIVVWDRSARPVAVVECKRPEVEIDEKVLDQAVCYNMALDLKWIFLTNGKTTFVLKKNGGKFVAYDKLPSYDEMSAR